MLYARTQAGDNVTRVRSRTRGFLHAPYERTYTRDHVDLEFQLAAAKGSLELPGQHGDWSIL